MASAVPIIEIASNMLLQILAACQQKNAEADYPSLMSAAILNVYSLIWLVFYGEPENISLINGGEVGGNQAKSTTNQSWLAGAGLKLTTTTFVRGS